MSRYLTRTARLVPIVLALSSGVVTVSAQTGAADGEWRTSTPARRISAS